MASKFYIFLYTATIFTSAGLLFIIQPMFSKMILPLLGGTPQVWNTSMVFFQIVLLAGYLYSHWSSKFMPVKVQTIVHIMLLLLFLLILPISIPDGWQPAIDQNPTIWQLLLMTITVGGPFFVLSGSAPLLQYWFSKSNHKDASNPYFLYAASNLGSISSLLLYPIVVEPFFSLTQQSQTWMYMYILLIAFLIVIAVLVYKTKRIRTTIVHDLSETTKIITWKKRAFWLLLSFIPSSLMLGFTTYVTSEIASVPLLWIFPFVLYLATFVISFSRKKIVTEIGVRESLGFILIFTVISSLMKNYVPVIIVFLIHLLIFFLIALLLHMRLSSLRPSSKNLTEFYLFISIGGALGGIFNALLAPNIFVTPIEYGLVLALAVFICFSTKHLLRPKYFYIIISVGTVITAIWSAFTDQIVFKIILAFLSLTGLTLLQNKRWVFGAAVGLILIIYEPGHLSVLTDNKIVHMERNFFGVSRVIQSSTNQRMFVHGITIHGVQSLDKANEHVPQSYYHNSSPIGELFEFLNQKEGNQSVAVLGLGIGVTACYDREGRNFDFYEIDPSVIHIAENPDYFTYLSGCGSPYKIIQGDARLTLHNATDQSYDLILVDAYSSDNIPVHLITKEAIDLYLKKLKPNGLLGFNITNTYLDLEPVLKSIADSSGIASYAKTYVSSGDEENITRPTTIGFAFARSKEEVFFFEKKKWKPAKNSLNIGLWTDQYSNLVRILKILSFENSEERDIKL